MPKHIVQSLIDLARQLPEFSNGIKGLGDNLSNPDPNEPQDENDLQTRLTNNFTNNALGDYSQSSNPNAISITPEQATQMTDINQPVDLSQYMPQARSLAQDTQQAPVIPQSKPLPKARPLSNPIPEIPQTTPNLSTKQPIPEEQIQEPKPNDSNIRDIENQASRAELINRLGKSAELLGVAIAGPGAKATAQDVFDSNIKAAEGEVQKEINLQKNDPNSDYSKKLQQIVKDKYGTDASGLSAEQLKETALKPIVDSFEKKEARELQEKLLKERIEGRKQEAQLKGAELKQSREDKESSKKDAADTKRLDTLNTKITGAISSSRSAFGQAARNAQAVENAEALLNGENMDYDALDNRQIYELAKSLDSILSKGNGGSTVSGTEHLIPTNAKTKLAKMLEFITSERQSAGQGSFVKKYADTLSREKDVAKKQMADTQSEVMGGMSDLKDHPRMADILTSHNIPSDFFDTLSKKTKERKENPSRTKINDEDKEAIDWAKNNPNDPRSTEILKLHGM